MNLHTTKSYKIYFPKENENFKMLSKKLNIAHRPTHIINHIVFFFIVSYYIYIDEIMCKNIILRCFKYQCIYSIETDRYIKKTNSDNVFYKCIRYVNHNKNLHYNHVHPHQINTL